MYVQDHVKRPVGHSAECLDLLQHLAHRIGLRDGNRVDQCRHVIAVEIDRVAGRERDVAVSAVQVSNTTHYTVAIPEPFCPAE